MNKKLEEKILNEIRHRVLKKDRELEAHKEEKEIRDANFEVLAEMTSLSRTEVDDIGKSVRDEFLTLQKLKQKRIFIIALLVVVFSFIAFMVVISNRPPEIIIIEEPFDENINDWDIYDDFEYKRYFLNSSYIFDTNVDGWCYWDDTRLDFPENYDVELTSTWKNGEYNGYGFSLLNDDAEYFAFALKANGSVSYGKVLNGKWIIDAAWQLGKANSVEANYLNVQKLEVRAGNFIYTVNGNHVFEKTIDIPVHYFGLRSCGEQKVAFQHVKIINSDTKEIIFEDNFDSPNGNWRPREKVTKKSSFTDGNFIFSTDKNRCYWASAEGLEIDNESTITLKSRWLTGEKADYGLLLLLNKENYISCELQNDGAARLVVSEDEEYTYIGNYQKTGFESTGNNRLTQRVEIKENVVYYYLNDKFVQKCNLPFNLRYVGLRVCETQSVSFEHLTISKFKKE